MEQVPAIARAETFIFQQLSGHLSIGVYFSPAPQQIPDPDNPTNLDGSTNWIPLKPSYCTFDLSPQPDTQHKQGVSFTQFESVCRVVVEGSSTLADEHLVAIEEAVAFASHDGVSLRRIGPLALPPYVRSGSEQPTFERGLRVAVRVGD